MKQIHILETLVLISDTVYIDRHNAHKQELFGVNNFYEAKEVKFFETKKFQNHCP